MKAVDFSRIKNLKKDVKGVEYGIYLTNQISNLANALTLSKKYARLQTLQGEHPNSLLVLFNVEVQAIT